MWGWFLKPSLGILGAFSRAQRTDVRLRQHLQMPLILPLVLPGSLSSTWKLSTLLQSPPCGVATIGVIARRIASISVGFTFAGVRTENLKPGIVVMESAEDGE